MSAKINVLKVFFLFFFCSISSFKGQHPYPNYHAKCQFYVKLYTHLPTLANVERGNPQNYDAFKKHIQVFTIPLPTLIPCKHNLPNYRLYQFLEARNFLFSPFLGNSRLQLSCWIKDLFYNGLEHWQYIIPRKYTF